MSDIAQVITLVGCAASSRSKELSAALQLYQQAAAVKLGGSQHPDPEGSQSAVAEASLKLALLCNELLQVR